MIAVARWATQVPKPPRKPKRAPLPFFRLTDAGKETAIGWGLGDVRREAFGNQGRASSAVVGSCGGQWPIVTVPESNARSGWQGRAARARKQRDAARMLTIATLETRRGAFYVVALQRVSPGSSRADDDNEIGALKAVRDGIADALRVDDGDRSRVVWRYVDGAKAAAYGVRVWIVAMGPARAAALLEVAQ